jgi:threonine dehydrogenase-like Zn-dependent dehydrogenase
MRAVCWQGTHDIQVETVPDPKILNPRDAILKVTTKAICGSDLMGEVAEVGSKAKGVSIFDRFVVPFTISCGQAT